MKKSILTAFVVVLAMASVASASTAVLNGTVSSEIMPTEHKSATAQPLMHAENVSLSLLEQRCVMLADTQPWVSEEHNFLGVTWETDVTSPDADIDRCHDAVKKFSDIIGEVTGSITGFEKEVAQKQVSSLMEGDKFIAELEASALENFRMCTAYSVVNSDFTFIGSHNRFERCRSALADLHKVFRDSKFVQKVKSASVSNVK